MAQCDLRSAWVSLGGSIQELVDFPSQHRIAVPDEVCITVQCSGPVALSASLQELSWQAFMAWQTVQDSLPPRWYSIGMAHLLCSLPMLVACVMHALVGRNCKARMLLSMFHCAQLLCCMLEAILLHLCEPVRCLTQ